MVKNRTALDTGNHTGRDSEHNGENQGKKGKLHGGGEQRDKLLEYRLLGDDRIAQIPMKHTPNIPSILNQDRFVQSQLRPQDGVTFRGDPALAGNQYHRISGDQMDQGKGQQRNADERGDDHGDAL